MAGGASPPGRPGPLDLGSSYVMVPDNLASGAASSTGLLTPVTASLDQPSPAPSVISKPDHDQTPSTGTLDRDQCHTSEASNASNRGHAEASPDARKRSTPPYEPIAIIGMGMRLPGGVHDEATYWDLLVNGRDGRCRVPETRYHPEAWMRPAGSSETAAAPPSGPEVPSTHGYFLAAGPSGDDGTDPLRRLDNSFWALSRQEAESMDPQQRLFLEVVHEALETAGATAGDYRGADVGVYVGQMCDDWAGIQQMDRLDVRDGARAEVLGDYIVANRASYEFDLRGPSVVARTACSSSLVALHMACRDLQGGVCAAAVVGGVNVAVSPRDTLGMREQGVLSPSGRCMPFDAAADGYARGEGVSAVYVKRLADAVRDGDPVRAVVRASCVSNDGRGGGHGITSPDGAAHERIMRRAYDIAKIDDLGRTAMVECHGTGTAVGDPIEAAAVAKLWGREGVYIGSVKGNIGHGEGASGLSSIIKMVLALEHSTIPPNINFNTPNPRIPWEEGKLKVPTKPIPWPADRLERVSVNSFGIGGTNAHIILESAACAGVQPPTIQAGVGATDSKPDQHRATPRLLVFSAKHPKALQQSTDAVRDYLLSHPTKLGDVAYSLAAHREAYSHRGFAVVAPDLVGDFKMVAQSTAPSGRLAGEQARVVWVFTGQGAQWAQMGKELVEKEPLVRQRVEHFNDLLASLSSPPSFSIKDEIMKPHDQSRLYEAEYSQPCMIALQLAMVDLLKSWGVTPAAVVGHSSGETAAAYAAGAVTADDAFLLAYHRGQITPSLARLHSGGMAAVGLGKEAVSPFLQPGVIVGCENSPASVTLSGDRDALVSVMAAIADARPDVLCRRLKVECGYHSQHMASVAGEYWDRVTGEDGVRCQAAEPAVAFYSSVTAALVTDLSPKYFLENLVSPVLFDGAVRALLRDFPTPPIFVEIGPHSALAGPVRQIAESEASTAISGFNTHQTKKKQPQPKNSKLTYIPTLVRSRDGMTCLLETAGSLWLAGAAVRPTAANPPGAFLPDMPTYQWHYAEGADLWRESRVSREWRLRRAPHHELLGSRCAETGGACPAWRCRLPPVEDAPAWLRDHAVRGAPVLPAAGLVAMVGEALRQLGDEAAGKSGGSGGFSLRRVAFIAPLVLGLETVEVITGLVPDSEGWYAFSISSITGAGACTLHATGKCTAGARFALPDPKDVQSSTAGLVRQISPSGFYGTWKRFGLEYGAQFQRIRDGRSHVSERRALAVIDATCRLPEEEAYYQAGMHPAALDAAFHSCMVAGCVGLERNFERLAVPRFIDEIYVAKPPVAGVRDEALAMVDSSERPGGISCSNILGVYPSADEIGQDKIFLHVRGFEAAPLPDEASPATSGSSSVDRHMAAVLEWKPDLDFDHSPYWITPDRREYNAKVKNTMELLGHKKPAMRILEIETRSGGRITDTMLQVLKSREGRELYSKYVLVSCSEAKSKLAQESFEHAPRMGFGTVQSTPEGINLAQALDTPGSFDLVTVNTCDGDGMPRGLEAVRQRLGPRGRLVISDSIPDSKSLGKYKLYMNRIERLRNYLRAAGFAIQRELVYNYGAATIMAHAVPPEAPQQSPQPRVVNILARNTWSPLASSAAARLRAGGYKVQWFLPGQLLPTQQVAVSLLDLDEERGPFLHGMGPDDLALLKVSVLSLQDGARGGPARLLWVTGAAQVRCRDPRWALVLGAARSIRRETGIDLVTLELEGFDGAGWDAVVRVLDSFGERWQEDDEEGGDAVDPESEYVFSGGAIQIARFGAVDLPKRLVEQPRDEAAKESVPKALSATKRGIHTTLEWKQQVPLADDKPAGNAVQVKVRAFALSPGELQAASGDTLSASKLGFLASGVVSAVGPHVEKIGLGDRVVVYGSGCATTSVRVSEEACFRLGEHQKFEEAVSIPMLEYCSASLSLEAVAAGLQGGQSILIHRAGTTVGQAALEMALGSNNGSAGQIFVTVASDAEADEIVSKFGIPRNRVFVSGTTASFLYSLKAATDGKGVDVVLSTFADPALVAASWKCLAPYGHLIQLIGWEANLPAHDIGNELDVNVLQDTRTFSRVDLAQLSRCRPQTLDRHMHEAMTYCRKNKITTSSQQIRVLEVDSIKEATRLALTPSDSSSSAVVKLPEDVSSLQVAPTRRRLALRPDRTYVIVGGVGGLGIPCARFLAERGARHLVLFSRSAATYAAGNKLLIEELEAMGCQLQLVSGSVSDRGDVARLTAAAPAPIGGIIHSAMVLQDSHLASMTYRQWRDVLDSKVLGTWNLHDAIESQPADKYQPLDFLVLFSSLAGLGGQVGQTNYAAANTFQDAFVQYRRSRGLACAALDIGIMEGVGILARETRRLEALRSTEHHVLHEQELLDALELVILDDATARRGCGGDGTVPAGEEQQQQQPASSKGYVSAGQLAIGLGASASGAGLVRQSAWRRDPRMQAGRIGLGGEDDDYDNDSGRREGQQQRKDKGSRGDAELAEALARSADDPTEANQEALTAVLARQLAAMLRKLTMRGEGDAADAEREVAAPMRSLGVDSLVSVEMRAWLRRKARVALSVHDVRGAETLTDLARLVTQKTVDAGVAAAGRPDADSSRLPIAVPGGSASWSCQ